MFRWTHLIHSIAWLSIDFLGNARNVLGEIHMKKMLLREIAWEFRLIDLLECWTLISKLDSMYIFIIKYKNIYTYVVCVLYRPYHKNMTQRHDLSAKSRLSKRAYYFIISHIVLFHFTARHLAFICIYILVIYMCVYCSYVCLYLSHMNCTTNDDYYFFFILIIIMVIYMRNNGQWARSMAHLKWSLFLRIAVEAILCQHEHFHTHTRTQQQHHSHYSFNEAKHLWMKRWEKKNSACLKYI